MATIADAIAGDVRGAENGSMHPGQMPNTAGLRAGSGRTGSGLKAANNGQNHASSMATARYG